MHIYVIFFSLFLLSLLRSRSGRRDCLLNSLCEFILIGVTWKSNSGLWILNSNARNFGTKTLAGNLVCLNYCAFFSSSVLLFLLLSSIDRQGVNRIGRCDCLLNSSCDLYPYWSHIVVFLVLVQYMKGQLECSTCHSQYRNELSICAEPSRRLSLSLLFIIFPIQVYSLAFRSSFVSRDWWKAKVSPLTFRSFRSLVRVEELRED